MWIEWSVKASLLRYVASMSDGAYEAFDGAEIRPASFRWPCVADPGEGRARQVFRARGSVVLRGHGGLLYLPLTRPTVTVEAGAGTLAIDFPWASTGPEPPLEIATVSLLPDPGEGERLAAAVQLTEDGAELFRAYPAGESMDHLFVTAVS
ncbi:HtaA domain-containing protein [Microbacterium rhizophilus]|uniref:HtaA domain-containing protein n=1 Tax=Microbacterium rhizophilus TaxID=3138934 RepID=UPI0031E820D8